MVVNTSVDNRLLRIEINNPPVNALSAAVRGGLLRAVREVERLDSLDAAVLYCLGTTFIAGADLREMNQSLPSPQLPEVIQSILNCQKPIIAIVQGMVLGGGLEVALACRWRLARAGTRFGFPEVALGLIPGAGGTQMLPRLVGSRQALEMISSGRPITVAQALQVGLVDAETDLPVPDAAQHYLEALPRTTHPLLLPGLARDDLSTEQWEAQQTELTQRTRGQRAPLEACRLVRLATEVPMTEGLEEERRTFLELRDSSQSRALRHLFFAERSVVRPPQLASIEATVPERIGVVGGGTMGSGIATAILLAGLPVTLIETDSARLDVARQRILNHLQAAQKRGLLTMVDVQQRFDLFHGATTLDTLADRDLVIEAVFEDLDTKQSVFRQLDTIVAEHALLATNTSYLDVDAIASVTHRPESVLGLHFFSPAHVMKLIEVVRGRRTTLSALASAFALARKLGKIPVEVGVCDGFVGNRILRAYRFQAETLLQEGCLPKQVDDAMTAIGFPMGPFAMQDLAGLDISWEIRKRDATTRSARLHYVAIADRLCEMGRFGQKTGAGWYRYAEGSRTPIPDPVVTHLILADAAAHGIARRDCSAEEIQLRILAAMVNEGAHILNEEIVREPRAIDVIMVNGYGFPRYLGGPMHYADDTSLTKIIGELQRLALRYPYNLSIAPLLLSMQQTGAHFEDVNQR